MSVQKKKYSCVTLAYDSSLDGGIVPFFCPDCTNLVCKYSGAGVQKIAPTLTMPRRFGVAVQCSNSRCKHTYFIEGVQVML